jgi:hypothetical protein
MKRRQPVSPLAAEVEVLENRALLSALSSVSSSALTSATLSSAAQTSLLNQLSTAPSVTASTSTVANGELNPYGTAFVPQGFAKGGLLKPGDLLVSNFNNSSNQQGTGSTIVDIHPDGSQTLFFQGTSQLGLTTALGVLKGGFVIVGSLPATYDSMGNLTEIKQGSLLILDKNGHVVKTLTNSTLLDGPWDLAVNDQGETAQIFVSSVLNGTVSRIDLFLPPSGAAPKVVDETLIGSGYLHRTDPAALVVGPTGLAFDKESGTLFVASTGDNAIYAIHDALDVFNRHGKGQLIYSDSTHLHGPLGLVLLPNGNLIASEGDAVNPTSDVSELTEFTQSGKFIAQFQVDTAAGSAFGIAIQTMGDKLFFAAVDDNTNSVTIWTLPFNDQNQM